MAAVISLPVIQRPRTRGDCDNVPRPCPFVSCRHNLYFDINSYTGSIIYNFKGEPDEMPADKSCSLDIAEAHESLTCSEIADILNMSRQRVLQIEDRAIQHLESKRSKIKNTIHEFEHPETYFDSNSSEGGVGVESDEFTTSFEYGRDSKLDTDALLCERMNHRYSQRLDGVSPSPLPLREGEETVVAGVYISGDPHRHAPEGFGESASVSCLSYEDEGPEYVVSDTEREACDDGSGPAFGCGASGA